MNERLSNEVLISLQRDLDRLIELNNISLDHLKRFVPCSEVVSEEINIIMTRLKKCISI